MLMNKPGLVIIIFLILSVQACDRSAEYTDQLNHVILPLPEGSPLEFSDEFLEDLAPWDSCTVIGMGEATHGTLDFVELRQRLFRFLAEHHHCRILAYEYSYRKSLHVDAYIQHKHKDLDSLFRGDLWIQDNDLLRYFVQWMREYNEEKQEQERIHFVGIDNQVDALYLQEVLQQVMNCLPGFEPDLDIFPYNVPGKKEVKYQEMNRMEYEELCLAFRELKEQAGLYLQSFNGSREHLQREVAFNLIRALQGSHEFLYRYYADGENIRDRQLADNVLWLERASGGAGPVALWAHNAHVAANPHYTEDGLPAMGWYLRDSLEQNYFSVATSFSLGQFTAVMYDSAGNDTPPLTCEIREDPPAGSFNKLFHRAGYQRFVLKVRELDPGSSLFHYLNTERPMIGVGDLYLGSPELHFTNDRIINLVQAHDLLFYFRDTRPLISE